MVKLGRILALALVALWSALAVRAEVAPGMPYIIEHFGTRDKQPQKRLPQSSVITLLEGRNGYLWLGTLKGLVRFDGSRFTVFNESNTPGLPNNSIVYLFEDSRGWLWIGTDGGGVALVRDGQVIGLNVGRGSSASKLRSACEDASGAVWLYTDDGQIWRYAAGQLSSLSTGENRHSDCRAIIAERGGPVWVGSDWGQLGFENGTAVGSVPAGNLDFLLASRSGGYWRLADHRIEKWTTNHLDYSLGFYPWPDAPNVRVTSACEDLQGHLIVGVLNAGAYWFDQDGKATSLSTNNGLSHAGVLSVCVDREDDLWVGTDGGGLNRVKRRVGQSLPGTEGRVVQSACEDAESNLWVGCNESGIVRWTPDGTEFYGKTNGLISPNVWSVFADREGKVWAGTRGPGGLHQFHDGRFFLVLVAGVVGQEINALHQDRAGRLWVGTPNGLASWDGQVWKTFTTLDGLAADAVRAIADDPSGNLWIGTVSGGLNQLRNGRFTVFRKSAGGLPGDNVSALLADDDGTLWVGTGSGLARLKDGHWTHYTTQDGLVSDSISYLVEDGEGFLWIGSNAGLMRVARKSLNDMAEGRATTISCRTYDEADGLPTSECTEGSQPAAVRTRSGELWFPTIDGLVGINPVHLQRNTNQPPVMIESVSVGGHEQLTNGLRAALPEEIVVPPEAERLDIQFTSLNLAAPERALFRFQLEGHENSLSEPRTLRIASFSKLPPGSYRFHVIAANEDGVWNKAGCSLAIRVLPPFWRTRWFMTGSTLVLLVLIVATVYFISTQRLQRELALLRQKEALERERSRIARDLHDQLGANLTRVSLLGELVESDKGEPAEVEAHARQISKTATETAHALDEIVWAANPANDTLEGLVNYVCKYAQEFLTTAGLRCRLDVPAQLPAMPIAPEFRHNLFLVAKEAVNNVVKHAKATSVRVQIKLVEQQLVVEVEDDGCGPAGTATAAKRGRNGLRNMSRRMEDVGGKFSISPAPERGTLVRLTAPLERK